MFRAIHLTPARGKFEGMRAFHVNLEPIAAVLHLARGQDLRLRIVLHHEMVARLQVTALANRLRNHDLAAAGESRRHISKQHLPVTPAKGQAGGTVRQPWQAPCLRLPALRPFRSAGGR